MIIGAGIGGLTAALALQRAGIRVDVYEQASRLGEIGAGLHLTPNGSKVLRALGLESELRAARGLLPDTDLRFFFTEIPPEEVSQAMAMVDQDVRTAALQYLDILKITTLLIALIFPAFVRVERAAWLLLRRARTPWA